MKALDCFYILGLLFTVEKHGFWMRVDKFKINSYTCSLNCISQDRKFVDQNNTDSITKKI